MNLHLEYRLWIADMNADINVLRIFDDYLKELMQKKNSDSILKGIESYKKQFSDLRKEIDELRHEMHLNKMNLAASGKTQNESAENIEEAIHHQEVKERYNAFRKTFDKTKKEFQQFVGS
jgi:seryl-tRNA synthetase